MLLLTPGNASDVTAAPAVLAEAPGRIRRPSTDKGHDADARADRNAVALRRPARHSRRNDAIGQVLDSLPPQNRDPLPDADINALT